MEHPAALTLRPVPGPAAIAAAGLVGALVLLLALFALRGSAGVTPVDPSSDVVMVALADGAVVRLDVATGEQTLVPSSAFGHLYAEVGTQIAVDTRTGALWYSDTHSAVRSIDPRTLAFGASLSSFADAALVGCATVSDGRPLAVDSARRRLFIPVATGGMLIYSLDSLHLDASVPSSALEVEPGLLPALAFDEATGALWYSSMTGDLVELNGRSLHPTGRRLSYATDPHVVRALSASGGALLAVDGRGVIRAYDLRRGVEVAAPDLGGAVAGGHAVGLAVTR